MSWDYGYLKSSCDDVYDKGLHKKTRKSAAKLVIQSIQEHLDKNVMLPAFLSEYLSRALKNRDELALGFRDQPKPVFSFFDVIKIAMLVRVTSKQKQKEGDAMEIVAEKYGISRSTVNTYRKRWESFLDAYERKYGLEEMPGDDELMFTLVNFVNHLEKLSSDRGWETLETKYGMRKDSLSSVMPRVGKSSKK